MSILRRGIVLLGALLLIVGCTTTIQSPPTWIDSLYDQSYDEKSYICAVGAGSTRDNAVNAAFAALSQTFNTQVESILTYSGFSSAETQGAGETIFYDSQALLEQSQLSSKSGTIIGGEVVNSYVDANQTVWVRVAIHRQKTAQLYSKEMDELARQIATIKLSSATSPSPLRSYFCLLEALPLAVEHLQMAQQIALLTGESKKSYLSELNTQLDHLASNVTLALEVSVIVPAAEEVATHKELTGAFRALFNDFGFNLKEKDAKGIPIVKIGYSIRDDETNQGPYSHAYYTLSVAIVDGDETIGSYQKSQRESAMTPKDARTRALRSALNQGVEGFKEALR